MYLEIIVTYCKCIWVRKQNTQNIVKYTEDTLDEGKIQSALQNT